MLTRKTLTLAAMLTATVTLAGCFTPPGSADVYSVGQAQREQTVRMGTVESVRAVRIQGDGGGSALGTLGGGALGAVGQGLSSANGVEITVRLDNGDLRSITQAATPEVFRAGERVRLLSSGGVTRVTH